VEQTQAAKKNVRKAAEAAREQKSLSTTPKSTKTALGKQGAAVVKRKRIGASMSKTRAELLRSPATGNRRPLETGPRRVGPPALSAGRDSAGALGLGGRTLPKASKWTPHMSVIDTQHGACLVIAAREGT
jgi:hypothetical protein